MEKPCKHCVHGHHYETQNGEPRYYCSIWIYDDMACRNCEHRQKYEDFLESRRKYKQGKPVKNIQEYFALKEKGESLFYWRGAIRHFKVLECLQFRTFVDLINHGNLYRAIKKQ